MKLQIIEYKASDANTGNYNYMYTLEIAGRLMLSIQSTVYMPEYMKEKLMRQVKYLKDEDLTHYHKFENGLPGAEKKILFEQEVTDHYLKDLKIQKRIKELEGDFAND